MLDDLNCLSHHVCLIALHLIEFFTANEFLHPTRVKVDMITAASTVVSKVFNGQTQTAWASRANHDPVAALWEILVAQLIGKLLVIVLVVIPTNALLWKPGRSTSFENVERTIFISIRNKALVLLITKPVVFEVIKFHDIIDALHLFARIPASVLHPVEPERRAGFFGKVPFDDFLNTIVQL